MSQKVSLFVSCPKGLQYALEKELHRLGVNELKPVPSGVHCSVDKAEMYRILLWSRIANRVTLELVKGKVESIDALYDLVQSIDWEQHFDVQNSFAIEFFGTNKLINNSTFGALKIKDAIVDQFRLKHDIRPSIDKENPDLRISAKLSKGSVTIGIDVSGESLHKRGYRTSTGKAPLKENLAAGLLELCGWPHSFESEASFVDPMCGSGTLLIEAAMALYKKAPGLDRELWGFSAWKPHDERLWNALKAEAEAVYSQARADIKTRIVGFDEDSRVISRAWENIKRAGFDDLIHVEKRSVEDFVLFERMSPGLLLTNPPYGERLGEVNALKDLYQQLGSLFESHCIDWKAGVFTSNLDLGKQVGWRSEKPYKLYNGALESVLLIFNLSSENRFKSAWRSPEERLQDPEYWQITNEERAAMFKNRLLKNLKTTGKWAAKKGITCYRLYDADMPEFAVAIDCYRSNEGEQLLHVQEYVAPKKVDEQSSIERLREALAVIPDALGVSPKNVALKRRKIQKGTQQYEKNQESSQVMLVSENKVCLEVNLFDYLDTGVFLDHRPMRLWVQQQAKGQSVLNLFCYTGSVTAHAVVGDAASTLSVDMSRTYLDWAKRNLELNASEQRLKARKDKFLQADCLEWLKGDEGLGQFDLVFLDPPSFSNSKRMEGILDVQRDHAFLVERAMLRVKTGGALIFSNNFKRFRLDESLGERYKVTDFKQQSIDKDFARNKNIHHCWKIEHQ